MSHMLSAMLPAPSMTKSTALPATDPQALLATVLTTGIFPTPVHSAQSSHAIFGPSAWISFSRALPIFFCDTSVAIETTSHTVLSASFSIWKLVWNAASHPQSQLVRIVPT